MEEVLKDLAADGYDGWVSIEPHVAAVFHDDDDVGADDIDPKAKAREQFDSYVRYGRELDVMVKRIQTS